MHFQGSCLPTSTSVFIDTSVTCRDVISLILASRKLQKDPAQYCLHLVDPNSECKANIICLVYRKGNCLVEYWC